MQRVSFVLRMKPGMEAEYDKRHAAVDPELLAAFARVGIHGYSIFRHGTTLFAYMEVEDFDTAMKALDADPANARWQEYMKPIMEHGGDAPPLILPEVFRFDAAGATQDA